MMHTSPRFSKDSQTRKAPSATAQRGKFTAARLRRRRLIGAALFAVALLMTQSGGQAQTTPQLPYSKGFLVTGDYVVGGVDLREDLHPVVNGFSTADIPISGVPADADIVGAYLFWETTTHGGDAWQTEAAGVQFRGFDIDVQSDLTVRTTSLPAEGASCFGSGSVAMHMFMSDVLRFLPVRKDQSGEPTTKYVVNSEDLAVRSLLPHRVKLPVQNGNGIAETSGTSLIIVYSDPDRSGPERTKPLKKVVIYGGNNRKPSLNDDLVQTIQGFYGSAKADKSAKITYLLASGQPNSNLKVSFSAGKDGSPRPLTTDTVIGASPFTAGPASQRWWANPTVLVGNLMKPDPTIGAYDNYGDFGETVSTRIYHSPTNGGYDCVALGAVVFSTTVQDAEKDGLPDALEDSATAMRDPPPPANYPEDTNLLPNLHLMGADRAIPDVFIEVNALWAPGADPAATPAFPGTRYGSVAAPSSSKAITSCAAGNPTVCTTAGKHNLPAGQSTAIVKDTSNVAVRGTWTVGQAPGGVTRISDTTFSIPVNTSGGDAGTGGVIYVTTQTDAVGHHHMPTPYVLGKIGDAFWERGIRVHFDVGKIECDEGDESSLPLHSAPRGYRCPGTVVHTDWIDDYTSHEADDYLIPTLYARGGEFIEERACNPSTSECQFPDFPGTIGWALGAQFLRDMPVGDAGEELTLGAEQVWSGRLRFDRARKDFVRYLLYAHGRAKPRSLPCLVDGRLADYDSGTPDGTACTTVNPDFDDLKYHAPSSTSGIANLPGRNAMITVGLWDEFVGRPIQQLGTTFHEIGHMLGLWHGGKPAKMGDNDPRPGKAKPTFIEPNCKPNYLSSMSYNFQVHGLFDDNDDVHVDFSGKGQNSQSDQSLTDHALLLPSPLWPAENGFRAYRPAWFAPVGSPLVVEQGASEAKKYCTGATLNANVHMARVQTNLSTEEIVWDGGGTATFVPDANFDGIANTDHTGYDDWFNIRLNQIGSTPSGLLPASAEDAIAEIWGSAFAEVAEGGPFVEIVEGGPFAEVVEGGPFAEIVEGGPFAEIVEGGFAEMIEGGPFVEIIEGGPFAEIVEGGPFAEIVEGMGDPELSFEDARAMGKGRPYKAKGCVVGRDEYFDPLDPEPEPPIVCATDDPSVTLHNNLMRFLQLQVGGISAYQVQRKAADRPDSPAPDAGTPDHNFANLPPLPSHLFTFTDHDSLANDVWYTYRVKGLADDGGDDSGWSRSIDIQALNERPQAFNDGPFDVASGSSRVINVAANDTDPEGLASIYAKEITLAPAHGTAKVNADGTVTYTANAGYVGPDSFSYVADNGPWSGDKDGLIRMSDPSDPAEVTINVTPPPPYGFKNLNNLPPAGNKSFKTGSTVPLRWQWTRNNVAANTAGQAIVNAYVCSAGTTLPPGFPVGRFDPSKPGSGNSFSFDTTTNTWNFNWKLVMSGSNLPVGTYVVNVENASTKQVDPNLSPCKGTSLTGALVTVVKQ